MNNLIILPLVIPLGTAIILLFFRKRIAVQRWISVIGMLSNIAASGLIVYEVHAKGVQTLRMGGWTPPYGIVFVADMLAALLTLTTAIIGLACLFYAFYNIGEEREKKFFYPFFNFLLVGVSGSFLTGDLFNLFVCFEVMLIASYGLIALGGTRRQLRETLKYILVNIISSTLFVASVAYLYSVMGTLNMAHLSVLVAEAGQDGILTVISMLFLIVFSLKAGLFLFFWLPGSYAAPPAAVTALFGALLTKVGLYAIIRVFTLIFYHEPQMTHSWIGWMAAATMLLGGLGAIAYSDLQRIMNYNVVISAGFIAFGLAVANKDSLDGIVFYLLHDMVAKGLMYFLGGMIIAAAGTGKLNEMGGLIKRYPFMGWMFFVMALTLVGVPPLSGFTGKMLVLRGGFDEEMFWLAAIGLGSSLLVLYSMMRIFTKVFWGKEMIASDVNSGNIKGMKNAAIGLFVMVILIGLGSEWLYTFVNQAGDGLIRTDLYIEAVFKG